MKYEELLQHFPFSMYPDPVHSSRDKNAVTFKKLQLPCSVLQHNPASVYAQQYLERSAVCMIFQKLAALFRIKQHTLHLKITAAAQQLCCTPSVVI